MRLYLIRHGQTEMNAIRTIDTVFPGAHLSQLGRQQAQELVEKMEGRQIDSLYVSSLVRTHETAAPLAQARGLEPIEDERFREIQAGSWEGLSGEDAYGGYLMTIQRWMAGEADCQMGEGTTGTEVLDRFDAGVRAIEASGVEAAAVVSHGGVIGYWTAMRATGLDPADVTWENHLRNANVAVLEGSFEDGYRLLSWNGIDVPQR